jgi:hypothetical protein
MKAKKRTDKNRKSFELSCERNLKLNSSCFLPVSWLIQQSRIFLVHTFIFLFSKSTAVHFRLWNDLKGTNCLTRLRWAVGGMDGQSLLWGWTSDRFYNYLLLLDFKLCILLSSEVWHKGAPLCAIVAILLQICHKLLATHRQISYGGKRVLATLWQIFHRVSEVNGSPLTNSSEGISTFCK